MDSYGTHQCLLFECLLGCSVELANWALLACADRRARCPQARSGRSMPSPAPVRLTRTLPDVWALRVPVSSVRGALFVIRAEARSERFRTWAVTAVRPLALPRIVVQSIC